MPERLILVQAANMKSRSDNQKDVLSKLHALNESDVSIPDAIH
jgi:hypothetical protein